MEKELQKNSENLLQKSFFMKRFTLLKLNNCLDKDNEIINVEDVKRIIPVVDKNGKPSVFVTFYDVEFCVTTTTICDSIEFETKEIEENLRCI